MQVLTSKGNSKIGKDTLIINITSAKNCPSKKLGLCQLQDNKKCYAMKAECQYPSVLPYRERQTEVWDGLSTGDIAMQLITKKARAKNNVKYLRLSEAGDFRTQADVDKASELAKLLTGALKVYGYTARKDLDFSNISSNLTMQGSGFMISNEFKAVKEYTGKSLKCKGNCRKCNLCKQAKGRTIEVLIH